MGTSVQRLLIMLVLLNFLLVTIASVIYAVDSSTTLDEADTYLDSYDNWTYDMIEGFPNPTTDSGSVYIDKSYGDVALLQSGFWGILKGGLSMTYGSGCLGENCDIVYVNWLVNGIKWIIKLVNLLAILQILYIGYSKKHD